MASCSSSRSSYALCAFLIGTLSACGGDGNQGPSSATSTSQVAAVSAWTAPEAFGVRDEYAPRGRSLAIGNDGQSYVLSGTFGWWGGLTPGTSTTSLTAFHK